MKLSVRAIAWAIIAMLSIAVSTAWAEEFPAKRVTLIVPYAAGGGTDILGRLIGQGLSTKLGRPVVIENHPGAASMIGARMVAQAPADGHTLLMATVTTLAINPTLYKRPAYDAIKDFAPVALVAGVPFVLVVNPKLGVHTLQELIALAKRKPGALNYASAGSGTPHHLFAELFRTMAGLDIKHVPYKGTSPAISDVVAGHVPMMFSDVAPALPLIADGKVIALGVTPKKRVAAAPQIPTIEEAGLPGYQAVGWQGLVVPAQTPKSIVDRLSSDATAVLTQPETRSKLIDIGFEPLVGTPAEFDAYIRTEIDKWAAIIKASGIPAVE